MFQKIAKHRANDASNDVHRPPLSPTRQLAFVSKKRARQLANPTYQANTPKLETYQPTTHQHVNLSPKTPKLANPTYQPPPKITHRATIPLTAYKFPTDSIHCND